MGSSRFLPLVIAGLVGLFVGWLFGPDVDDVEKAVVARVDRLDGRFTEIQAPIGAVQAAVKGVDDRTAALAAQIQAIGNPAEAVNGLSAKLDAMATAAAGGKAAADALASQVAALQAKLDALAAASAAGAASAPGTGEAEALAARIGNVGAVLLAGQTAVFGEKRLTLTNIAGGHALLGAEGAAPAEVAPGASIDLGDGCSVTLAGISGSAAYVSPVGCRAATAVAAPAEPPAPAAETPRPAAATPAPAAEAAETPSPAAPAPSGDGTSLRVGQTGIFGDKRAFLSRLADNTAFLFVPGRGQISVASGAAADLGDGCTLTLGAIEAGTATFSAAGCAATAAPAEASAPAPAVPEPAAATPPAAPAPDAADAAASPAPAGAPAPASDPAAAAPAPGAPADAAAPARATPGGPATLSPGQTARFGDKRLFLSRVTPEKVFVVIVGAGTAEVALGGSADLGGGCMARLDAISGSVASFTPTGC